MESLRDGRLRRDSQIKGLYEFEKTLGKGHFAIVKLAKHLYTGERVAIKVIDKSKLDEVSRAHLYQEVACMKMVKHENIVQLYEVIDSSKFLYIVQELGDGGDMYDFLTKHEGGLPEDKARDFFQQIVSAITYCHDLHIVHRDLKPENVVLSRNQDVVKITDFGFSNQYTPGTHLRTSCGSLAYSAPEILLGDSYEAAAVDVWSLGVLLYMLVCGEAPFNEGTDSETLTMIMDCRFKLPPELSPECQDLVSNLLKREPADRLSLAEILAHPWMQQQPSPQPTDSPLHHNQNNRVQANNTSNHAQHLSVNTITGGYRPPYSTTSAAASSLASYRRYPVITRDMITDDEHKEIVECMTMQNIADEPAILDSLNTEAYDHISATYFLLAEKRLRLQHDERLKALGGPSIFGLCSPTGAVSGSQGSGLQPSNPPVVNGTTGGLVGLQCQGRRSPLLYTPIQVNAGQTTVGAAGSQFPQQQQSTPYNITQVPAPNSPMQQMGQVSQVGVAAQLSNRSGNGSADISIISNAAQMLAPGTGRPSNSINTTTGTGGMQLPLSNRSASNSFTDEPFTDISERRASETQTAEKPKTQRSWSAGPGISTAIIRHGSMSVGRDSASPSPPPMLSRFTGVNSFESLATHNSQLGGTTSSAGTPSGARVPHREHLTIAPSYNRNILKEDVNKLMEREQEQRLNLSVCENDIPNLLLVPSSSSADSVIKPKISSTPVSTSRGTLQSSRLSEPHAGGLGKLVEEEGESELDDFEDGTGPFLGGPRTSRSSNSSRFKSRNHSLGTLFSRKQNNQQRRLSAGHSPECLRRNANSGGALGPPGSGSGTGSVTGGTGGVGSGVGGYGIKTFALSRRSTPTRSHHNSDESGGEDGDNRLRNISRFSESDRSLGYSHRQQRHSFNQLSDDSSVERPVLFSAGSGGHNASYQQQNALLAGMERNDLSGSSNSTPNNRRHRRKKKSLNENMKMSNLSVSSMVSNLSSKYPIDPTNNTPSDSDSVSSRKTSSYACNKLVDAGDIDCSARLLSGKHNTTLAANLINLVEEEPMSSGASHDFEVPQSAALGASSPYRKNHENSLSSESGTHVSLEGRPNVKCEYNKFDNKTSASARSRTKREASSSDGTRKRRKKTRKTKRIIFTSCMKNSMDASVSPSSEEKIDAKCSESQSLLVDEASPYPVKEKNSNSSESSVQHKTLNSSKDAVSNKQPTINTERDKYKETPDEKLVNKSDHFPEAAGDSQCVTNADTSKIPASRCCGIQ
ncbi:uncharacterized protein LOC142334711 isoform X2 [Convolutriloba macropyga]|uniref:uncharacterized protein LOC142334711 isoform X2 n=1 Tax=Convolutriloba macropyga TaxID=536237 RepID=UPI003F525C4B